MFEKMKRLMDIILAIVALILFFPIMLLAAMAIRFTSPGPIFADIPKRAGKSGRLFRLYKFRSMIPNAYIKIRTDPKLKKLLEEYQKSGYKLHNDPRITPIGKFIRKTSIDEMPQFINVLLGDMSVVGPRPYYPEELKTQAKQYPGTKELIKEALTVKPGITGYWQVSGRSEVNFDKRIAMDARYARSKSILWDIWIMIQTPWVVFLGKGAV